MEIVIVGASGHGMVVCDALLLQGARVIAFIDADPAKHGTRVLDIPVVTGMSHVTAATGRPAIAMGIGDNAARRREFERWRSQGYQIITVTHPAATVSPRAQVGAGAVIMANVVVNVAAEIGENAILNSGCTVDHHCVIGAHAHVAPAATLAGNVRVGAETLIGAGAVIVPGISIGSRSVLGAGAVALEDIGDDVTYVGVPARAVTSRHPTR